MAIQKPKYIITEIDDVNATALDWGYLAPSMIQEIPGRSYFNVPAITEEGVIIEKTVVYVIPVDKFPRGTSKIEGPDFIIGY